MFQNDTGDSHFCLDFKKIVNKKSNSLQKLTINNLLNEKYNFSNNDISPCVSFL
jgi:hypothetical protein